MFKTVFTVAVPFLWIGLAAFPLPLAAADGEVVFLWPNGAPGSEGKTAEETVRIAAPRGEHIVASVHRPSITVFLPDRESATGVGVVIAPGGGHRELWMDHEGYNVARWLSSHGIAGFVLKYRLAREKDSLYTVEGHAFADMRRAIRVVRTRAEEWNLDPQRIGVMGFSAGGELAALAGTRYDAGNDSAPDPIERQSSRPAFQALIYPAIPKSMPVSQETPAAFLVCGEKDRPNISQGLPELYLAIKRAGGAAELHIYTNAGHGFGIRDYNHDPVSSWPARFYDFLQSRGLLKPASVN
jgi:acetyl esterase/lipase